MLSREAAKRAMSLISNISDPVSTIHSQFVSEFSFEERYSILSSLSILLCEALLDHQQQISAALLIYSSFDESPLSENPFVSTFLYIASSCSRIKISLRVSEYAKAYKPPKHTNICRGDNGPRDRAELLKIFSPQAREVIPGRPCGSPFSRRETLCAQCSAPRTRPLLTPSFFLLYLFFVRL